MSRQGRRTLLSETREGTTLCAQGVPIFQESRSRVPSCAIGFLKMKRATIKHTAQTTSTIGLMSHPKSIGTSGLISMAMDAKSHTAAVFFH